MNLAGFKYFDTHPGDACRPPSASPTTYPHALYPLFFVHSNRHTPPAPSGTYDGRQARTLRRVQNIVTTTTTAQRHVTFGGGRVIGTSGVGKPKTVHRTARAGEEKITSLDLTPTLVTEKDTALGGTVPVVEGKISDAGESTRALHTVVTTAKSVLVLSLLMAVAVGIAIGDQPVDTRWSAAGQRTRKLGAVDKDTRLMRLARIQRYYSSLEDRPNEPHLLPF